MFGLCFTYTVGLLLILASYITDPICSCLYRRYKFREYAHLEWVTNATLHFQRMAYQGVDSGEWSGQMDDIPRTQPGEVLVELPRRATTDLDQKKPENSSTTDQSEQTHENLEVDSLIDSAGVSDMVSLPGDPSDQNVCVTISTET